MPRFKVKLGFTRNCVFRAKGEEIELPEKEGKTKIAEGFCERIDAKKKSTKKENDDEQTQGEDTSTQPRAKTRSTRSTGAPR